MSETSNEDQDTQDAQRRKAMSEVQEQLDADAEGDGLAAEAGRSEENGLAEG